MMEPEIRQLTNAIRSYFEQWRVTTEAEGHAIRAGRWTELDRLQESKRQLQQFITGATAELRAACVKFGHDPAAVEEQFQDLMKDLIEMEGQNQFALNTQMLKAQAELQETDVSARTLHKVRRTYGAGRGSNWESFS